MLNLINVKMSNIIVNISAVDILHKLRAYISNSFSIIFTACLISIYFALATPLNTINGLDLSIPLQSFEQDTQTKKQSLTVLEKILQPA